MAQETILKVSLREYKQGIDDLRASLLGLDRDSEEYGRIVEEIAERQDNLNDAMNAGKRAANAVDGSYNALVQTLSNLKREWRNIEIGTPEWEAMAVRIDDINNQLKDADAKVGVFTRNVGDYANAFEEGFKQALGGLSKMPGVLGQSAGVVKQLIPLIKQTNNTAVAGLTGVRKALASTGIGALIVAVGLLIANFDKLENLFKNGKNGVDSYAESTKKLREELESIDDDFKHYLEVRRAAGDEEEKLLNEEKKHLTESSDKMAETIQKNSLQLDIWQNKLEKMNPLQRWASGLQKKIDELQEKQDELVKDYDSALDRIDVIDATIKKKNDDRKKKEEDDRKAKIDAEKKTLQTILDRVEDANRTEIEKLTKKYQEEYKLLKKYGKDTTLLTEQYNKAITDINEKALDNITANLMKYQPYAHLNREYRKAADVLEQFQQIVNRTFPPEAILKTEDITEDMIKKAQKLGLVAGDTAEEFSYAWEYAYENFKGTSNNFAEGMHKIDDEFLKSQEILQKSGNLRTFYQNEYLIQESVYQELQKMLTQVGNALFDFKKTGVMAEDFMQDFVGESFETTEAAYAYWSQFFESLKVEVADVLNKYNIAVHDWTNYTNSVKKTLKDAEAEFAEFGTDSNWQWITSTSFIYDAYQKRLDAAIWYRDNLEIIEGETEEERQVRVKQAENEILKIKREYAQKHIEVSQSLNSHLTSLWGSLIDIRESNMKRDEKTDKEIFEKTKSSKKGLAIVETIQGALAAFMGYQQYPQPYGAILGAAAAAATAAAGAAQIAAIEATQFDDKGNEISNPVAVINATPRMADYSPDMTANLTGASETQYLANALQQTPIYVSVTDINNAQAKVTDRNNESSF